MRLLKMQTGSEVGLTQLHDQQKRQEVLGFLDLGTVCNKQLGVIRCVKCEHTFAFISIEDQRALMHIKQHKPQVICRVVIWPT
jgi:hypothetical protein